MPRHPSRHALRVIPLLLAAISSASHGLDEGTQLRSTVVTATRHEADIDTVNATVTSINRDTLDKRLPVDDADLFRDEPDVSMARDLRRHGATRVNIRGIEDNRVIQIVDGVRQPDYFNGGGPTNYTMSAPSAPMPDFLRQLEIVRGPSSSLYGSDAIGGVVGYLTLNPEDIAKGDKKQGVRLRGGYFGATDTLSGSVVGAWRGEMFDVLLGYAQANGSEADNKGKDKTFGPTRSAPNPSDTVDRGALAKFILRPLAGHKLTLALEGREQEAQTEIMRIPASLSRITSMSGDDETRRGRISLEYEHAASNLFYDRLIARTYHQEAETDNINQQRRENTTYSAANGCSASRPGTAACAIEQRFQFEQQTSGLGLQLESAFQLGATSHLLTYGADLMRQRIETLRDGRVENLATNAVTYGLAGESWPLRDFANGVTDTVGLFAQGEISLFAGRLALTPGIRYDHTRLKPEVDALAQQVLTIIGREAVEQEHGHLSPKLGGQWKFNEQWSLFGQVASGFRAPNYNEVNGAFRNAAQLYATSPNPDLKPETSVGVELGMRLSSGPLRAQATVFDNHYKNFIENVRLSCPADPGCITIGSVDYTTYMSRNLNNVRIYGAEFRGGWDFAPNWRVDGAIAYAHGENTDSGVPLNSVEPLRLSLGLGYDVGRWGGEWRLRAAAGKDRVDDSDEVWFRTPGYAVSDFAAWIRPTANTRLVVALNNVFDQKYWLWGDIRQADTSLTAVDFYTQPGRNLRVAFQADF
jgi:hemoglobin/transferrin/lactoferrin receptor protein